MGKISKNLKLSPETALLVEALQAIHQAEDKIYSALDLVYGETSDSVYDKVGLLNAFQEVYKKVQGLIGLFVDLDLGDILTDPTKEEGVC